MFLPLGAMNLKVLQSVILLFVQELVSFIQKQDSLKTQVQKGPGGRPMLPKSFDPKKVSLGFPDL